MAGARHSLRLPWISVAFMFKTLSACPRQFVCLLFVGSAQCRGRPSAPPMVLLTENFPPYNMAKNGKNFAKDENIEGIAADIVRETFKRAGITYSLTLRFPWERIYKLALEKPGYGVFVMARLPDSRSAVQVGWPYRPGRLGACWPSRTARSSSPNSGASAALQDRRL